jgi:hypothetical protein
MTDTRGLTIDQAKKQLRSSRGSEQMQKYMTDIAEFKFLVNLVSYLNKDIPSLPAWEQQFIASTKGELQKYLAEHFESSAKSRSLFVSMPAEQWQEPGTTFFNLTEVPRAILGYLPKQELKILDEKIESNLMDGINACRSRLDEILVLYRFSPEDRQEVDKLTTVDSFFIEDYEKHKALVAVWEELLEKKAPVVKELGEREKFLQEVEEFEKKASQSSRFTKSTSLQLAEENKFRSNAAKKIHTMEKRALELCAGFLKQTSRKFEIDGIDYLAAIGQQEGGRTTIPSLSLSMRKKSLDEDGNTRLREYLAAGKSANCVITGKQAS